MLAFGVAAVAGLVLALVVDPWLLLLGAASIAAAALYTGGPKPYGYLGLGELMVLVFFGFVATVGSAYVQLERVPGAAWWGSLTVGLLACAILLANNVRDVPTDTVAGKRTLAVRVGAPAARRLFVACYVGRVRRRRRDRDHPAVGAARAGWPSRSRCARCGSVLTRTDPPSLVAALVATSKLEVVVAVLLGVGLCLS